MINELIQEHNFVKEDENEYVRDNWTLKIESNMFALYSDPEIDTRYYYGYLDQLETYLNAIK